MRDKSRASTLFPLVPRFHEAPSHCEEPYRPNKKAKQPRVQTSESQILDFLLFLSWMSWVFHHSHITLRWLILIISTIWSAITYKKKPLWSCLCITQWVIDFWSPTLNVSGTIQWVTVHVQPSLYPGHRNEDQAPHALPAGCLTHDRPHLQTVNQNISSCLSSFAWYFCHRSNKCNQNTNTLIS